jgi:hypothetical protein
MTLVDFLEAGQKFVCEERKNASEGEELRLPRLR